MADAGDLKSLFRKEVRVRSPPLAHPPDPIPLHPTPPFDRLLSLASGEVGRVVAEMPPDLRRRASDAPVRYEERVAGHWLDEGIEPDSLGLFSGPSLRDPDASLADEQPLVTLFLRNLWDWCEGDESAYLDEVARTYLHEFGHYLGLEENEMESRDLD